MASQFHFGALGGALLSVFVKRFRTMSTLATSLWLAGGGLLIAWLSIAFSLGWTALGKREARNARMESIYRRFGEDFHPVGRLRWCWIALQSIPILLLFSLFAILVFLLHLPYALWCSVTGRKPVGGGPPNI